MGTLKGVSDNRFGLVSLFYIKLMGYLMSKSCRGTLVELFDP